MAEALSSLDFGDPERIARANARADGSATPLPQFVPSPWFLFLVALLRGGIS